jgi:hypothetical protein
MAVETSHQYYRNKKIILDLLHKLQAPSFFQLVFDLEDEGLIENAERKKKSLTQLINAHIIIRLNIFTRF